MEALHSLLHPNYRLVGSLPPSDEQVEVFLGSGKSYATSRVYPAVRKYYILFFKAVLMRSELRVVMGEKSLVGGRRGKGCVGRSSGRDTA